MTFLRHIPETREANCLQFDGPGKVSLRKRIVPFPSSGHIRVRVVACGVCHREINVLAGRLPRTFPDVMGHEPVGLVDAIASDVTGFRVGQWVTGVGNASLAEYDISEARFMVPLKQAPANPAHYLGEPAMCAINAINRLPADELPVIVVHGVGFMGNLLLQALRYKRNPRRLIAIDTDPSRLRLAAQSGADETFTPNSVTGAGLMGSANAVFEVSGAPGTIMSCTRLVRNGGILALFGHHFEVEPSAVNEWHLRGITVLNTVPWAAPDLAREVREAVDAIEFKRLRMDCLIDRTVCLPQAGDILSEMAAGIGSSRKTVVIFPL